MNISEKVVIEFSRFFAPLVDSIELGSSFDPPYQGLLWFAERCGFRLDDIIANVNALEEISTSILSIFEELKPLVEKDSADNFPNLLDLVDNVKDLISALNEFDQLEVKPNVPAHLQKSGQLIFNHLTYRYLQKYHYNWLGYLKLLGVIRTESLQGVREIEWERIFDLIKQPEEIFPNAFGWGRDEFYGYAFLDALKNALLSIDIPVAVEYSLLEQPDFGLDSITEKPVLQLKIPLLEYSIDSRNIQAGFMITPLPDLNDRTKVSGLAILPFGYPALSDKIDLGDGWCFYFNASIQASAQLGIFIQPGKVKVIDVAGDLEWPEIDFRFAVLTKENRLRKYTLFEEDGYIKLAIGFKGFELLFEISDSFSFSLNFPILFELRLLQRSEDYDSFLNSFLPEKGIKFSAEIALGFSSRRGLSIDGSANLAFNLPINRKFGPLKISQSQLEVGVDAQNSLRLATKANLGFNLGPISASVQGIGTGANINFGGEKTGVDLFGFEIIPPSGISIGIDTDLISGGGLIELDPDNGRYSGILHLKLFEIGITAIGVLDTKDANGRDLPSPGFSFLIVILADLPMIQLGFGFTLNGVGGLIGVHRTTDVEALKNGLKTGAVDSLMFPEKPLENMPRIINDIRNIFPPKMDQFLFGPMLQIGWGSPTVFEIEMGLILDLPNPVRLILLGQLHAVLPSLKAPIIVLNVDLIGVLDFGGQELYIEANIRDSRLAAFNLTGGMVFLLRWGNRPDFILSIGGFHPDYAKAPALPSIRRLRAALGLGDFLSIAVEGYLAITANSFQFGARAELFLGVDAVNIHGWLSFDALLTFSPFYFRFDFSYGFTVNVKGQTLAGITFSGTLEGPNPFRIAGEGCISVLFFDICVDFDFTIGEEEAEPPLPLKDPWDDLRAAIEDAVNWEALLPDYARLGAIINRDQTEQEEMLVHPMGDLIFTQNVAPLNRKLEKFGEYAIEKHDRFNLLSVEIGGSAKFHILQEYFAAGQYEYLTEQQKMTQDSFELMDAGIRLSNVNSLDYGAVHTERALDYEKCIIDASTDSRPLKTPIDFAFEEQRAAGANRAKNSFQRSGRLKYANSKRSGGQLKI